MNVPFPRQSRTLLPGALGLLLALSACGEESTGNVASTPAPPRHHGGAGYVPPAQLHKGPALSARVQSLPGLEGVIGASTAELSRQFGTPRLDVWEGDARKLQFTGTPCVLDVYLYPAAPGADPRATYVDARRATDGRDVDRAACVAALKAGRTAEPRR